MVVCHRLCRCSLFSQTASTGRAQWHTRLENFPSFDGLLGANGAHRTRFRTDFRSNELTEIEHYFVDHVPNPSPTGGVDLGQFHKVRNTVFRACRKHGRVGAMGLYPFTKGPFNDVRELISAWSATGDSDPDFFLLDDQLNDERYQYLECCNRDVVTEEWIHTLMEALLGCSGWGVGIKNVQRGYVLVFARKILVTGPVFRKATTLSAVVEALRESLG